MVKRKCLEMAKISHVTIPKQQKSIEKSQLLFGSRQLKVCFEGNILALKVLMHKEFETSSNHINIFVTHKFFTVLGRNILFQHF